MTLSHVVPLRRPSDGLIARLALVDEAEETLDLQYYSWNADAAGYLVLSHLIAAADRGVSVRLLVDDLKLRRRTRSIASLCIHPNLEVRVFNPFGRRSSAVAQAYEFMRRFRRLDERMHNKLLIADGVRAICGGRNIAAEHFGLAKEFNLIDYDLLVDGSEVSDLSDVFEIYWQSPSSVSGSALSESVSAGDLTTTRALIAEGLDQGTPELTAGLADAAAAWHVRMDSIRIPLDEGTFNVVSDVPDISSVTRPTQVIEALQRSVDGAVHELVVATPFFVPSDSDVEWYQRIVDRGVRMRILTNSLASNQGTISNSGLNKKRLAVIKAGVELRELRTDAAVKREWEIPPQSARYLGLHAKLYVIDRESVFLGSVNLDPRSKFVNTEMGVLIRNTELAEVTASAIVQLMTPDNAWQVEIGPDEGIQWRNELETLHRPPARNTVQRVADALYGLLPIHDYI